MFLLHPDLDPTGQSQLGGKGHGLWRLLRAGARIPPTLCVPPQDDPDQISAEVAGLIGPGPYAVRSSAAAEDGPQRSYAGQFDSLLRVPPSDLGRAIRACRASAHSERARSYGAGGPLSVLIQPMVAAERAGVLFTCDPVSGSRERVLVEWCPGTAEGLVGGSQAGEREWHSPGSDLALVREALALQERLGMGAPLDFEWAEASGEVVWLQVRPVTAAGEDAALHYLGPRESPRVGAGETHWTSVNAREALPNVLTPLMQELMVDLIHAAFMASLRLLGARPAAGQQAMGVFHGRVFLNVTALEAIVAQLPIENPQVLVEGILVGEHREAPRLRFSLSMLPNLARLLWGLLTFPFRYRAFERERWRVPDSFEGVTSRELWQAIGRGLDLSDAFHLHVLGSAAAFGALARLEELAGSRERASRLLQGLGTFRFASAAAALRDLVVDPGALEAYLEEYGHLGPGSLDLNEPTWRDDPAPVLAMVERLRQAGEVHGRRAYEARLAGQRHQAEAELLSGQPWWRKLKLRLVLALARAAAPHRENTKFLIHRRLAVGRAYLHELERRLGVELTYLYPAEVEALLDGAQVDSALIEQRKLRHRRDQARPCPLHRVQGPDGLRLYFPQPPSGTRLEGIAGSPGLARGRARVLLSLQEAERLQSGEVLVTTTTDPCWTPLFSLAAAVVVEVGGVLSHGAVVAREVGIPAVLGVHGLMAVVRDGDELEVDGSNGVVRRL